MWKKYFKIGAKVVVSIWLILCVVGFFKDMFGIGLEVAVPACDSKDVAKTDLIPLINNMEAVKNNGVTAVYIDKVSEVSFDKEKQVKICKAVAKFSNAELIDMVYKMYIHENELFIEVDLSGEDNGLEACGSTFGRIIQQEAKLAVQMGLEGDDLLNRVTLIAEGIGERNNCNAHPILEEVLNNLSHSRN